MILSDLWVFSVFIFILCQETLQLPKSSLINVVGDCECGKLDEIAPRIVGGKESKAHSRPWMAAILKKGKLYCGGSLINDRYILTAGHCLVWSAKKDMTVALGLHDRTLTEKNESLVVQVEDVRVHEHFSSDYLHDINDIGLIKLKTPVKFTSQIQPVCLPKVGDDYATKRAVISGWGRTTQDGDPSNTLKEATVKMLTNEECRKISSLKEHILDTMMCAYNHNIDACQGDSGGPLVVESQSGNSEQIGVVSWGIGCAQPGMPGVYTRITSYLDWIALHTTDAKYCRVPA